MSNTTIDVINAAQIITRKAYEAAQSKTNEPFVIDSSKSVFDSIQQKVVGFIGQLQASFAFEYNGTVYTVNGEYHDYQVFAGQMIEFIALSEWESLRSFSIQEDYS